MTYGIWWKGVGPKGESRGWVMDTPDDPSKFKTKREASKVLSSEFHFVKDYEVRKYKR